MAFHRSIVLAWLAGIPIVSPLIGCSPDKSAPPESATYPGSFRIEELASTQEAAGTKITWLATAVRGTKSARFRIELLMKPKTDESAFGFTKGAIVRDEGSDGTSFLAELSEVLGSKVAPPKAPLAQRLEFQASVLGSSLSRDAGPDLFAGSFTSHPPGNWIAVKVFVADGEGEFFLNLNPANQQGEIAPKDEEYGDVVVGELAKILLPMSGT
jgi:hypothetical protein